MPAVLILAGGVISQKLPYLKASCPCPALIPVNTRPLASYVMDAYRGKADIHLIVDEVFADEVSRELPPRKHGYSLHGVKPGHGVLHTLKQALEISGLNEDLIINLVTTIPPSPPPPGHVQVAEQPARINNEWSAIRTEADSLSFYSKGELRPADASTFTGVFRLPLGVLSPALEHALSENDLLSVLASAATLGPIQLQTVDWIDCGHETNYYKSRATLINSRSFNSLKVDGQRGTISKSSQDKIKLSREATYFECLPSSLRVLFPRLVSQSGIGENIDSYEMEYYGYPNLAEYLLYWDLSEESWWRCYDSLSEVLKMFRRHTASIGPTRYREFHWEKTISRIDSYLGSIDDPSLAKILGGRSISLNNEKILPLPDLLASAEQVLSSSYRESNFSVFHGDFCFNNILFDVSSGIVRLIDPRGSFGDSFPGIYGDWRYDLAKLTHSATGHYDYFVNGLFDIWSTAPDTFHLHTIQRPNSGCLPEMNAWLIREQGADVHEIQVITGLLFLSMCPLHRDDHFRQLAFFLRGMKILHDSFN